MKDSRFYQYTTIALLLLNISLLAFLIFSSPAKQEQPPHNRTGPRQFREKTLEILELDEKQTELFYQSADSHNIRVTDIEKRQRELLKPYFSQIFKPDTSLKSEELLGQSQALYLEKIEITYRHFNEVRSILRPGQKDNFATFMNRALEILLLEGRPKGPPGKGGKGHHRRRPRH